MSDSNTFPSRFGFHPCDRQTFLKLKALKKYYWQNVRDFYRWWRWQRKLASPLFRHSELLSYVPIMVEAAMSAHDTRPTML